ncbi:hypothetical protein R6Z07F_015465 [Ovis aries]
MVVEAEGEEDLWAVEAMEVVAAAVLAEEDSPVAVAVAEDSSKQGTGSVLILPLPVLCAPSQPALLPVDGRMEPGPELDPGRRRPDVQSPYGSLETTPPPLDQSTAVISSLQTLVTAVHSDVQKGRSLYHGTFDAFIKILRADGVTGLYRGFLVNTFTLISGQCYVTTYELTRKFVADYSQSNTVKSLVAGGSASLVAQSITVPIDVVSQQLMMQRKGEKMGRFQVRGSPEGHGVVAFGQTKDIIRQILRADGLGGFYRGYVASLLTYIPNSAVWWPFCHFCAEQLSSLCPKACPHIVFQAISGPLAAATASILTNPMDVIRTREQVEGKNSIILTFRQLMAEEGPWGLMKGLSARSISATPSTIVIVVGYESLKKLSLRSELVDSRHW